jgi:hypothetical protein
MHDKLLNATTGSMAGTALQRCCAHLMWVVSCATVSACHVLPADSSASGLQARRPHMLPGASRAVRVRPPCSLASSVTSASTCTAGGDLILDASVMGAFSSSSKSSPRRDDLQGRGAMVLCVSWWCYLAWPGGRGIDS